MIKYISIIIGLSLSIMTANTYAATLNDDQKDVVDRVVTRLYTSACTQDVSAEQCTSKLKSNIILITTIRNHRKIRSNQTTVALLDGIIS